MTVSFARVLVVIGGCLLVAGSRTSAQQSPAASAPLTVVVLPFRNSTGSADFDPLCDGMPDILPACVGRIEGVVFVERARLNMVLDGQRKSLTSLTDAGAQIRLGKLLGAKCVISGGFAKKNGDLQINSHLYEVETARLVSSAEAVGKPDSILETLHANASRLFTAVGKNVAERTAEAFDHSPESNLHFMRGLGYYYGNMPDQALAEFMKATALDPRLPGPRYWRGKIHLEMKEYEHAAIELKRFVADFPNDPQAAKVREMLSAAIAQRTP